MAIPLPGVGATCVLKSPFNNTLDMDILKNLAQNISEHTFRLLAYYYREGCERVFVPGIRLENYVPQAAVISNQGRLEELHAGEDVPPTGNLPFIVFNRYNWLMLGIVLMVWIL